MITTDAHGMQRATCARCGRDIFATPLNPGYWRHLHNDHHGCYTVGGPRAIPARPAGHLVPANLTGADDPVPVYLCPVCTALTADPPAHARYHNPEPEVEG